MLKKLVIALGVSCALLLMGGMNAHADEWYSPFHSISDNILCKKGYPYSSKNLQKGICKVNWGNIVGNVANNMAASWGDIYNPLS